MTSNKCAESLNCVNCYPNNPLHIEIIKINLHWFNYGEEFLKNMKVDGEKKKSANEQTREVVEMELCLRVTKSVENVLSIAVQTFILYSYLSLLRADNGDGGFLPGRSLSKYIIDQYATTKRNEITVAWSKSLVLTNLLVCTKVLFIITWISDATVVNFVALMMSSYINFVRKIFQQGHTRAWCHRQGCLLYRKRKKGRECEASVNFFFFIFS